MAFLVALMIMTVSVVNMMYVLLQYRSVWQVPATLLNVVAFSLLFLVVALFPDGKFAPKWSLWLRQPEGRTTDQAHPRQGNFPQAPHSQVPSRPNQD